MICANLGGIGLKASFKTVRLNTNDEVLADLIINSVEDGIDKSKKLIQGSEKIENLFLKKINDEGKISTNKGWEHSEVEDWKVHEKEFFDPYHMTNLRRSMVSGGILNPPDRPRKISAKYHGIEPDERVVF